MAVAATLDQARASAGRRGLVLAVGACLLVYAATAWLLARHQEFWSPDSALRFVQVGAFAGRGFAGGSVPYPAVAVDPEGRFFPAGPWFHFSAGGRQYIAYLPYFPLVTAPLYRALGFPGLVVLPLLGGMAAVVMTCAVLRRLAPEGALWGALALGLGTPLLVYSTVFWDHSLVTALAAGALALAAVALEAPGGPRLAPLGAAGALLGLGLWLRNEMYPLAAVALAAWFALVPRRRLASTLTMAAGVLVTAAPLWALNVVLQGRPLGWKGQGLAIGRAGEMTGAGDPRSAIDFVVGRWSNAYFQLVAPEFYAAGAPAVLAGMAVAVALLLAALLLYVGVRRAAPRLVLLGGLLAPAVVLLVLSERPSVSGLLPAAPLVILAVLGGRLARWEGYLWTVTAAFIAAIVATGTHGGMQWGPRYLMPVVPALVWLSASAVARAGRRAPAASSSVALAAGLLLAASILVQAAGVDRVDLEMSRNVKVNDAIRSAPADVVVTAHEWLAVGAGRAYFEKRLMLVDTIEELEALARVLARRRVPRWTYIPRSGYQFPARVVEEWTAGGAWSYRVVEDRHVNSIRLVTYTGSGSR
jgi:hypothetical protein